MKFAIAPEHFEFFQKHKAIEFENLLQEEQLSELTEGIDLALSSRLQIPIEKIKTKLSHALFIEGRDLWRSNEEVRKVVIQRRLAEVAGQLLDHRPLRLGYDQLLPSIFSQHPSLSHDSKAYMQMIEKPRTLNEISSLQGIMCGLILCISGEASEGDSELLSFFPKKAGNGVFFQPDHPINFEPLQNRANHRYLMIVYTHSSAAYILKGGDPLTYTFKKWGYGIGDSLTSDRNPIVYQ